MSKDKGQKNIKKAPDDKNSGKVKAVSEYKSEGKITGKIGVIDSQISKSGGKS